MKSVFTTILTAVFTFGLTITQADTVTAQLIKKPEKGLSMNFTKIEFSDRGEARTKTTLSPGASVTYSIERPKTGYDEIKWEIFGRKRGFDFQEIEWTLKENGKTIKSGQLNSSYSIRIDRGKGYYKITLKNVSNTSAPLNLAWSRKSCPNDSAQGCTESKSKARKRTLNGNQIQVLPKNKNSKIRRVKRQNRQQ